MEVTNQIQNCHQGPDMYVDEVISSKKIVCRGQNFGEGVGGRTSSAYISGPRYRF